MNCRWGLERRASRLGAGPNFPCKDTRQGGTQCQYFGHTGAQRLSTHPPATSRNAARFLLCRAPPRGLDMSLLIARSQAGRIRVGIWRRRRRLSSGTGCGCTCSRRSCTSCAAPCHASFLLARHSFQVPIRLRSPELLMTKIPAPCSGAVRVGEPGHVRSVPSGYPQTPCGAL